MFMDIKDLPLHRLGNQQIVGSKFTDPAKLVAAFGAVQAQDYAAAKWALGIRLKNITDASLEKAFNDGSILRTHVMRPTWHFVAPQDIRWLLKLTAPRVLALLNGSSRKLGLDEAAYKRSSKLIAKALKGGNYLTRSEIEAIFNNVGIATDDLHMIHHMMRAELDGLICSGPRKGKQFTYALLDERVPETKPMHRDEALAELAKRYFTSHGPATIQDFAWWSGLTLTDSRAGLEMVRSSLAMVSIDLKDYWLPPGKKISLSPSAYLLPNYDEYTVAYKDRSAILDPATNKVAPRGDVIFNHVILYKGKIAGTWKRTIKKNTIEIEIVLFLKPDKVFKTALSGAVSHYSQYMELPVIMK
jgi:Winged helix DNA-binding domain